MNDLIVGLLLIFGPSTAYVLWLGWQARRGNPAVVAPAPLRDDSDWLAAYDDFGIVADVVGEAEQYVRKAAL